MTRRELSDSEWELVEPFVPIGRSGPCPHHLRRQFEVVIWKFRSGGQWREMPARCPRTSGRGFRGTPQSCPRRRRIPGRGPGRRSGRARTRATAYCGLVAIWIRLPQVSSKTAVVTGPISKGSWVKRTPRPRRRSYSAFTSSTANWASGMPSWMSASR
ncbi:hypothetical protein CLM62_09080 [Streptomyces sp. SA15]|nr:hypothetical protein CLM62_09080 [Streptomyces sp. SA15]